MGTLRYLDSTGDTKLTWDPDNETEVEATEAMFDKLMKEGFQAFAVKKGGKQGERITKFDPEAGAIIMTPKIAGG